MRKISRSTHLPSDPTPPPGLHPADPTVAGVDRPAAPGGQAPAETQADADARAAAKLPEAAPPPAQTPAEAAATEAAKSAIEAARETAAAIRDSLDSVVLQLSVLTDEMRALGETVRSSLPSSGPSPEAETPPEISNPDA